MVDSARGQQTIANGPKLSLLFILSIKLYWNPAMTANYNCFLTAKAEFSSGDREPYSPKRPKIFTIGFFTEKVHEPLEQTI